MEMYVKYSHANSGNFVIHSSKMLTFSEAEA
jgi:hypothetical protein